MEIIKDIEQGSLEWHQLRLGVVTASRVQDILTEPRKKTDLFSKTAETYLYELLAEILTGEPKPFFENDAMKWGTGTEPQARAMYELNNNVDVEQVAFIKHNENIGVSPDGLVGDNGLIEIKCPTTITQIKRSQQEVKHYGYGAQIQMQLWVSEREWCDFVSFDPRIDVDASFIQERVYRDEEYIETMKTKTYAFVEKLNELYNKLQGE